MTKTALWQVVEAHKALAAQEARLDLLLQQLADKEELLQQARQLVSSPSNAGFSMSLIHILYWSFEWAGG